MSTENELESEMKLENKDQSSFDIDRDNIVSTTDLNIDGTPHIEVKGLNLKYGSAQAIYDVSVPIEKSCICGPAWEWSSRSQTRSQNQFLIMLLMESSCTTVHLGGK